MNGRRILLIEDDRLLSEAFEEILRLTAGFEVETISDGRLAIERLGGDVVDLVFLDIHLPGVSGLDILEQIRADPRWSATQVVVMTADALRAKAAEDRADYTLVKPITLEQISQLATRLQNAGDEQTQ